MTLAWQHAKDLFCLAMSTWDLTCKRGSVGQSEGLSIPRSSVRFRLKPDKSNSHEFEFHRPSNKGTKLLLKVIKAIIIIHLWAWDCTLPQNDCGEGLGMQPQQSSLVELNRCLGHLFSCASLALTSSTAVSWWPGYCQDKYPCCLGGRCNPRRLQLRTSGRGHIDACGMLMLMACWCMCPVDCRQQTLNGPAFPTHGSRFLPAMVLPCGKRVWFMIAVITCYLVLLLEGLCSSDPCRCEFSGFLSLCRNRTDDLGIKSPALWPTELVLRCLGAMIMIVFILNLWKIM